MKSLNRYDCELLRYASVNRSEDDKLEKIIQVTQISKRHQTTIPSEVIDFLKLNPKGAVVWIIRDGEVIVRAQ